MVDSFFYNLLSFLSDIGTIGCISIFFSIPAFYLLNKRKMLYIWDYGLGIYCAIAWDLAGRISQPFFGMSFIDIFIEGGLVVFIASLIQYLKLFMPKNYNSKIVSLISIAVAVILALCIYYFMPSIGTSD